VSVIRNSVLSVFFVLALVMGSFNNWVESGYGWSNFSLRKLTRKLMYPVCWVIAFFLSLADLFGILDEDEEDL